MAKVSSLTGGSKTPPPAFGRHVPPSGPVGTDRVPPERSAP